LYYPENILGNSSYSTVVASAERFFSKLKLVKNYLRSAMSQTRLVDLAILNIEPSIARQLDFDSVIRNFANKNTKKSHI